MRTLLLPDLKQLQLIGKEFTKENSAIGYETNCNIADILKINRNLIDEIYDENYNFIS